MSYPRVERVVTDHKNEIILSFYTRNQAIEFNKDLCVGCYVCTRVCPQEAIKQHHHELVRKKKEDMFPDIPDAEQCSYCGTCVYMCPFSAIRLKKEGQIVPIEEIEIVKAKVLPKLDYNMVKCKKSGTTAKVYVEGKVKIDWNLCISCMSCFDVCPTGAFFKEDKVNDKGRKRKVDFNVRATCIKCGACENACSSGAIKVKIEKINYSGEFKEPFWSELLKRSQKIL
ncbi:MAG: 4Fe-4S binding protein [Candidatus Hermodarchaeota archaeon]